MDDATATMIRNLAEKTGKTLEDWVKIAKSSGKDKHGEIVAFLKTKHELGHGYANLVALTARDQFGENAPAGDDLVESQYAGPKSPLRPIYDALTAAVGKFGKDVELAPKKAYVSVRRNKQFALFQPSTPSRFDVGINLKGVAPAGRLEASGSWNAMVTHRVRLENKAGVDAELIAWLKKAYDAA
jgi:hypothetical protein